MRHARFAGGLVSKIASPFLSGSQRQRRSATSALAGIVERAVEGNAPLAMAIAVNAVLCVALGGVVVHEVIEQEPGITATLGFVEPSPPSSPPPSSAATIPAMDISAITGSAQSPVSMPAVDIAMLAPVPITFNAPSVSPGAICMPSGIAGGVPGGQGQGVASTASGKSARRGTGKIGKMPVKAERLGVILDVSNSMQSAITKCKVDIDRGFPDSPVATVEGCSVNRFPEPSQAGGPHTSFIRASSTDSSTVAAIQSLVINDKVDAIFWFSDLADLTENSPLAALAAWLKERGVRLYVRKVYSRPSAAVIEAVEATGGDWESPDKGR